MISVKIPEPQFESQTKDKLLNVEVESFVQSSMTERLGAFLEENPKEAKRSSKKACSPPKRAKRPAKPAS